MSNLYFGLHPKPSRPTDEAYAAAATKLGCDPHAIKAVAVIEAGPYGAFLPTGEPVILYERHLFHRLTEGRYDGQRLAGAPEECSLLSASLGGGYGPVRIQHAKLRAAAALDKPAALKSCSWGLYQILGENHAACGFDTVEAFVAAMNRSVDDHLAAFVAFVLADRRLAIAIRDRDWQTFARIYNGPQFAAHRYDTQIARAYDTLVDKGAHA